MVSVKVPALPPSVSVAICVVCTPAASRPTIHESDTHEVVSEDDKPKRNDTVLNRSPYPAPVIDTEIAPVDGALLAVVLDADGTSADNTDDALANCKPELIESILVPELNCLTLHATAVSDCQKLIAEPVSPGRTLIL